MAAPPVSVLESLASDYEPPKLDAGRKHGGKHAGKHQPPSNTLAWVGGFTVLGLLIVVGGMGYYFSTQDADDAARAKSDAKAAKAGVSSDSRSDDEATESDDSESEVQDTEIPPSKKKPTPVNAKKKSPPAKAKTKIDDDADDAPAEDEPATATNKPTAKASQPPTPAAKPKQGDEEPQEPARDPETESWKLTDMKSEILTALSTGSGLLDEQVEATAGKFLVLTLSITPKNRDKAVASLKDVGLSITIGGREYRNLRPQAVGNNEQGDRFFTNLHDFIGEQHLICGQGECKLIRATESDPATINVTVSPCRMSFAFHIPKPDESEYRFRFVDTVIDDKTDKAADDATESTSPDANPGVEP